VGFLLLRGRCPSCSSAIPRRHLAGELSAGAFWAAPVVLLGPASWLPAVLTAPLALPLLRSPVRARRRTTLAALLPLVGVALLTLGLVGLLEGRSVLYATGGALGTAALLAGAAAARVPAAPRVPAGGA
jgi:hypothetical protein